MRFTTGIFQRSGLILRDLPYDRTLHHMDSFMPILISATFMPRLGSVTRTKPLRSKSESQIDSRYLRHLAGREMVTARG